MRQLGFLVLLSGLWMGPALGQRVQLKPETALAFEAYVRQVEEQWSSADSAGQPGPKGSQGTAGVGRQLQEGRVVVEKTEPPSIRGGIINDWKGTILLRDVRVEQVASLLTDYDQHAEAYPDVIASRTLSRQAGKVRGFLKLRKKKILTAILNTEHEVEFRQFGETGWESRSRSTRIAEVSNPDSPEEQELPVGNDRGFLWRLNAYWRLRQVEEGVLAECRAVTLSRRIPTGLGWLIRPIANGLPRESLEMTLLATRNALQRSLN